MKFIALLAILVLAACGPASETVEKEMEGAARASDPRVLARLLEGLDAGAEVVTTTTGLQYVDLTQGAGDTLALGQTVSVHYTGWLPDGKKVDSSLQRGEPVRFQLGGGQVIAGWDEGVGSMRVGGRRRLAVPPELAYGERGLGPIPPNSSLIFELRLMEAEPLLPDSTQQASDSTRQAPNSEVNE